MPKFHVISGTLIVAAPVDKDGKPVGGKKQNVIGFGGEVDFTEAERHAVDPRGEKLATPEAFADLRKAADAHAAYLAKQKALGSAPLALTPKVLAAFEALTKAEVLAKPITPKGK